MKKCVVILSWGLDSAVTAYSLKNKGYDLEAITFDYWQRHSREIECAKALAKNLWIPHKIIDLQGVFSNNALTGEIEVPHGYYEEENMKQTVVANRNMTMISIVAWYAISKEIKNIAIWVHSWDHAIYPDCREITISAIEKAIKLGNWECEKFKILAPMINLDKTEIVSIGEKLKVPFWLTQTCYEWREKACGKCWSCQERLESFKLNNLTDPIQYENN